MNFIDQVLSTNYDNLELNRRGLGTSWETVLLTPRFVTSRHLVGLVFAPRNRNPQLVVKVPRQPGDNGGVAREAETLTALARLAGGPVEGVPEVVGTVQVGQHLVLIETAMTGSELDPARVSADLAAAVEAGLRFTAALPVTRDGAANQGWYQRSIAAPLQDLVDLVPSLGEAARLAERTHELLAPLASCDLPAVFEHADLSHPNVFIRGGRLQVVDWERASVDGLPAHDLVFYLQYLGECTVGAYARPQQMAAFDSAFGAHGWAVPFVQDHLRERDLDVELLPHLILATWCRSAATLAYRLAGSGASNVADQARVTAEVAKDRDYWLWRHALDIVR